MHPDIFTGSAGKTGRHGAVEWAVAWTADTDGFFNSYCNTIPTPDGGTHESGSRSALLRGLKDHAARVGQEKRATGVTSDDVMTGVGCMLSVFVREPEFQGQTKDRLATAELSESFKQAIKDPFDHWLAANPLQYQSCSTLSLSAEEHLPRAREDTPAGAVRKLRPRQAGRLHDSANEGSEIFIVECDSAGGSAGQARDRRTQAVCPCARTLNAVRGKEKLAQNARAWFKRRLWHWHA